MASFRALPLDLMMPVLRRGFVRFFLGSFPPFSFFSVLFSVFLNPDSLSLQHCQFGHLRTCAQAIQSDTLIRAKKLRNVFIITFCPIVSPLDHLSLPLLPLSTISDPLPPPPLRSPPPTTAFATTTFLTTPLRAITYFSQTCGIRTSNGYSMVCDGVKVASLNCKVIVIKYHN